MIDINSLEDPRIQEFRSLKDKFLKDKDLIIVESEKVVAKLIKSKYSILKILARPDFFQKYSVEAECFQAPSKLLEEIVGHKLHHGVMALAKRPPDISLDELDEKILVLNGLTSPENIGTLIRTAAGLGIYSVIVDHKTCSPYTRRCIRVSMGNIFRMKVHHSKNLIKSLEALDHQIIGTSNETSAKPIGEISFPKKTALIIGSEGHGMDPELKEFCHFLTKIPMDEEVAHLNAASAGAIALFQLSQFKG